MTVQEKDNQYIAGTYSRFPLTVVRGKGSLVWDENGKEYIDLSTGIAVNSFGVADSKWVAAVKKQASTLQHMSNLYYTEPCARLAELLCEKTGLCKVFFSNSGAEANECAIKVARKYAFDKYGEGREKIITLVNSFHGRTVTTLAATGQEVFHKDFLPLTEGFLYAEANDIEAIEKLVSENGVAAIMIETVQGEGGVLPLDSKYVTALAEICTKKDILLICDEVQVGNGRSGKLYGYMNFGISPDIVSTAKGLAGGLPLGATLLGDKVKSVLTPSSHGSTFGGNPVCCSAAISVLERIDDKLLKGVNTRSRYIKRELEKSEGVKSISGLGLMLGIETERDAGEVIAECMKRGVLVIKAKNKVRILPALNIPMPLLKQAVQVIKEVCKG